MPLAELSKQAERFDAVALAQDIAILEELRRQVRQISAGRALLDATLVRLALSGQLTSVADLMARVDGGATAGAISATPVQKKKLRVEAGAEAQIVAPQACDEDDSVPSAGQVWVDGAHRP